MAHCDKCNKIYDWCKCEELENAVEIQRYRISHNGDHIKDYSGPFVKFDDAKIEIERFFNTMVIEFSGTDNGHDVIIDDYSVDNGLRPFMEHYIKNMRGVLK
jgi:hypothetical protein